MAKKKRASDAIVKELRAFGLAYPGTHLKSPWPGHKDLAVKDKTFAYLSIEGEPFAISCKLPTSNAMALMLPFMKPTEYGLGKSGWVSATFRERRAAPGRHAEGVDRRELSRAGAEEAGRVARWRARGEEEAGEAREVEAKQPIAVTDARARIRARARLPCVRNPDIATSMSCLVAFGCIQHRNSPSRGRPDGGQTREK